MLTPFDDFPIHPSADPIAHAGDRRPQPLRPLLVQRPGQGRRLLHRRRDGPLPGARRHRRRVQRGARGRRALDVRVRRHAAGPVDRGRPDPRRGARADAHHPATSPIRDDAPASAATSPSAPAPSPSRSRASDRRSPEGILDQTTPVSPSGARGTARSGSTATTIDVDPAEVSGTRDRSWGMRPVGEQLPAQRQPMPFQVFWLWAPLHFDDSLHPLGVARARQTAPVAGSRRSCRAPSRAAPRRAATARRRELPRLGYEHRVGARPPRDGEPDLCFDDPSTARSTSRSRSSSPSGCAASATGIRTGRTAAPTASSRSAASHIALDDFDPLDFSSIHLQNLVVATMGDRRGVGVVEQIALGPHRPSGLTGFLDGHG